MIVNTNKTDKINVTQKLLDIIAEKHSTQEDVARLLRSTKRNSREFIYYTSVNTAVIERWGQKGYYRIRNLEQFGHFDKGPQLIKSMYKGFKIKTWKMKGRKHLYHRRAFLKKIATENKVPHYDFSHAPCIVSAISMWLKEIGFYAKSASICDVWNALSKARHGE